MDNSILTDIKKLLGISADDTSFDTDIIIHINSVLMTLYQIGIGTNAYSISGTDEIWSDFIGGNVNLDSVKTYIYLKVRLLFDPPTNSAVLESFKEMAKEYEWRLNCEVDPTLDELVD